MTQNNKSDCEKIIIQVDSSIEDLIPIFLRSRQKDIKDILHALEQGDFETILFVGHNMRGSGGGYGFDYLSETGFILELAAKEKDVEKIRKQIHEIVNYLEKIEIVYV